MIKYNMVWYGLVWYGMVWYDMVFISNRIIIHHSLLFSCIFSLLLFFRFFCHHNNNFIRIVVGKLWQQWTATNKIIFIVVVIAVVVVLFLNDGVHWKTSYGGCDGRGSLLRAEAIGMLLISLFIALMAKYSKRTNIKIVYVSDNLELIIRNKEHLDYKYPYPTDTLSAEFDITEQI